MRKVGDLPRDISSIADLETDPTRGRTTKRPSFTDAQIIGILGKHEACAKCADLSSKHGMSAGAFYNLQLEIQVRLDVGIGGQTAEDARRRERPNEEAAGRADARHGGDERSAGKNVWSTPLLQGFRGCPSGLRKCIRPLIS